jgi:hypothetical protein
MIISKQTFGGVFEDPEGFIYRYDSPLFSNHLESIGHVASAYSL